MKKIIFIVIFLCFVFGAYWYLDENRIVQFAVTTHEDDVVIEDDSTTIVVEDQSSSEWEGVEALDGWTEYRNEDYLISIQYPDGWEVQEALKPRTMSALHEIVVSEKEYEMMRASVSIEMFTNENELTVDEWWADRLAVEDEKKEKCLLDEPLGPCVHLRDLIEKEEEIQYVGKPALLVRLFQFDSEKECIYVEHDIYIYGVCYDGNNPNDPNFDTHTDLYTGISTGIQFLERDTKSGDEVSLEGVWQSADDELSKKVFLDDGVFKEIYNDEIMTEGTWIIEQDESVQTIVISSEDSDDLFTIVLLDDTQLNLTYVARGNELRYTRSID